jgi:hypothetical protein
VLDAERNELLTIFPDLQVAQQRAGRKNGVEQPAARKRRSMSPTSRKAHGERMRASWAKRRAQAQPAGAASPQTDTASDSTPIPTQPASQRKGMSPEARKAQGEGMRAYWAAKRAEKDGAAATDTRASGGSGARKGQKASREK